jgi:hypothetical protein
MAKYTPQRNDTVYMDGKGLVRYVVVQVNSPKRTADVQTTSGVIGLIHDVPWSKLYHLDESQNAARIVREATER